MSQYPDKIYVPRCFCKEHTFQKSGKTVLKVSFNVKELIEFAQNHADEKGYLRLGFSRMKETGKFGQTHAAWLDTWRKDGPDSDTPGTEKAAVQAELTPTPTKSHTASDDDDVPF